MSSRIQLLTPSHLRLDSRLPLELRSLSFQILPSPPASQATALASGAPPAQADGHAVVAHGLTKVTSSVFGPREPVRTGAFSGSGGGGAQQGGLRDGKASVNVEVGVAGWGDKAGSAGLKKGQKDRLVDRRKGVSG